MPETQSLRPVDVLVACKLFCLEEDRKDWTYAVLSRDLGISQATLHASVMRCVRAQILATTSLRIQRRRLVDLLTVAAPIVFFPDRGGLARGTVTAVVRGEEVPRLPYVWAGTGDVQGVALSPVYPTAPRACLGDERLYEILSLVDTIRAGGASGEAARAAGIVGKKIFAESRT